MSNNLRLFSSSGRRTSLFGKMNPQHTQSANGSSMPDGIAKSDAAHSVDRSSQTDGSNGLHTTASSTTAADQKSNCGPDTNFLIVGCGPAGASLACFLSSYGVSEPKMFLPATPKREVCLTHEIRFEGNDGRSGTRHCEYTTSPHYKHGSHRYRHIPNHADPGLSQRVEAARYA